MVSNENIGCQIKMILPLKKGAYYLRLEHTAREGSPPVDFGVYYSKDGQDDWWKNPMIRL